ncbi:FkbM family methyltransferase [Candidatus Nitrospira bockiana]
MRRIMKAIVPKFAKQGVKHLRCFAADLRETYKEATFRPYIRNKIIADVSFDFYIGDPTAQLWYDNPGWRYAEKELSFLRYHLIRQGDIVFDVGGHHGWNALIFSRLVGLQGKVFTFEPNPKNVEIIRRNISLNGCTNITVANVAVGPRAQEAVVANRSNTVVKPNKVEERYWPEDCRRKSVDRGIEVKMESLDGYARQYHICPHLLKVDVEGYEIEVLRGARSILSRKPKLCLEIHHPDALARYGTSVGDLFDVIAMNEYKLWLQIDNEDIVAIEDANELRKVGERFYLYALSLPNQH